MAVLRNIPRIRQSLLSHNNSVATDPYLRPQQRALYSRISAVERIVRNFRAMLEQNHDLMRDDSVVGQLALLEEWLDAYKRGLVAAEKIRTKGQHWIELHASRLRDMSSVAASPSDQSIGSHEKLLKRAEQEVEKPAVRPESVAETYAAAPDVTNPRPAPK